jgi:hypothetical protein
MKDDRDDVRENGTNGEDRKGAISIKMRIHNENSQLVCADTV